MTSHVDVKYEFGGPLGASAITFGLPILLYSFAFACNDVSGCPAPSLLNPQTLSWEKVRAEIGWPAGGLRHLGSWQATGVVAVYYCFSLLLWRVLPAQITHGTKLAHHGRPLEYHFNAFSSTLV